MIIMGIDQSYTCTGISVLDTEGSTFFTTIKTEKSTQLDEMGIFRRAKQVADSILTLIEQHSPDMVIIEGLAFGARGNATRDLSGLMFIIVNTIDSLNIPVKIVSPTSVKAFAVKGKASKKEMFDALPADIKQTIGDNFKITKGRYDVTDAYFLAMYGISKWKVDHN